VSIILAFTERPRANLRDVVRTGAVDLLHLPVSDTLLLETIERAIAMSRAEQASDTGSTTSARRSEQGTLVAVTSPIGGAGKTVLATNLAYFLRTKTGGRTCLVDLNLEFGRVASALRLRPKYTIVDLVQREEGEEQEFVNHLEEHLVTHDSGVEVLAAPKDATEAELIGAGDAIRVLQALRSTFDFIVVDTPASLTEVVLSALDLADSIFGVSTLDLPSLRTLRRFLSMLEQLKISTEEVRLVLNKEERDTGIDIVEVGKLFPEGLSAVLPYDRQVTKTLNLGVPILSYRPDVEFSRRLCDAFGVLQEAADAPSTDDSPGGGRPGWRRLFKR
jgi:pilus assembly protein CpaE